MKWKFCSQMMAALAILTAALALAPGALAAPKYRVLYAFKGGQDGELPIGGVILDEAGNLYGTTGGGGRGCSPTGCGTVFELTPHSGGGWTKTVLHYFDGSDGAGPQASLVFDDSGQCYMAQRGAVGLQGTAPAIRCGVVFELSPSSGGKWKETVLHRFAGGDDGSVCFAETGPGRFWQYLWLDRARRRIIRQRHGF